MEFYRMEFKRFLHPNWDSQNIFWYHARQVSWESIKIRHIFTNQNLMKINKTKDAVIRGCSSSLIFKQENNV